MTGNNLLNDSQAYSCSFVFGRIVQPLKNIEKFVSVLEIKTNSIVFQIVIR